MVKIATLDGIKGIVFSGEGEVDPMQLEVVQKLIKDADSMEEAVKDINTYLLYEEYKKENPDYAELSNREFISRIKYEPTSNEKPCVSEEVINQDLKKEIAMLNDRLEKAGIETKKLNNRIDYARDKYIKFSQELKENTIRSEELEAYKEKYRARDELLSDYMLKYEKACELLVMWQIEAFEYDENNYETVSRIMHNIRPDLAEVSKYANEAYLINSKDKEEM